MIRILLCDDHPLVREGIRLVLSDLDDIKIVGEAENGTEALRFLEKNSVDILLLDVNMPVLNGLETLKELNKKGLEYKVIVLSMLDDLHIIKRFVALGAKAYLIKNAGKEEIIETIRKVAENKTAFDPKLLLEVLELKKQRSRKREQSLFPKLSRREKEILTLIIEEFTTAEIAEKLYISFGTVETHRRNLINKLAVKNTAGLVRVAMEYNLLENEG